MRPRLLVFAGPNGSGKSTITTPEVLAYHRISADRYINTDLLTAKARTIGKAPTEEQERAGFHQARSLREQYRIDGEWFAFETVFSHPSTLLDMKRCRAAGFEIVVLFVTTENPEINVARVAGRVQAGGHAVPPG